MASGRRPARVSGRPRVAIVTGATEGIGLAVSRRLAGEGCRLVLVARRAGPGDELAAELGREAACFVAGDVGDAATADAAVEAAFEHHGGLDVLVNNAGLDLSGPALLDTTIADARRIFDVNVFGALQMLQAAARAMRERGGAIVNVTSRAALVGLPGLGGLRRVEGRAGEPDPRGGVGARPARHPGQLRGAGPDRHAHDQHLGRRSSPIPRRSAPPRRPRSRRAGWPRRTTWRPRSASWPRTPRPPSPAPACRSTAATPRNERPRRRAGRRHGGRSSCRRRGSTSRSRPSRRSAPPCSTCAGGRSTPSGRSSPAPTRC